MRKNNKNKNSPILFVISKTRCKITSSNGTVIYFSLEFFLGHHTAAQVTKIVLSRREIANDDNDEYNDEHQKRKISIRAFNTWLIVKRDLTDIVNTRSTQVVQQNTDTIALIVDGCDV